MTQVGRLTPKGAVVTIRIYAYPGGHGNIEILDARHRKVGGSSYQSAAEAEWYLTDYHRRLIQTLAKHPSETNTA